MKPRIWQSVFLGSAALILAIAAQNSVAWAHYIWVVSENGVTKVYFSEGLSPDQSEFLGAIDGMRVFVVSGGELQQVAFEKKLDGELGWFELANPANAPVFLRCDYGVFTRGEQTMRLDYAAKYGSAALAANRISRHEELRLDVVPELKNGNLEISVFFDGRPAPDIEVVVSQTSQLDRSTTLTTDEHGTAKYTVEDSSRVLMRAKKILAESGELDGKTYSEHRYYCTVAFDLGSESGEKTTSTRPRAAPEVRSPERVFPDLPMTLTSFGAVQTEGHVYVLGGQIAKAHSYAKQWQNGKLLRLSLEDPSDGWTVISEIGGVQGLALLCHDGKILRIGGFEARNGEGEPHDLHSLTDFQSFDPRTREWTSLPPLPEPRSSFDACLIGDRVFVVGGWTLRGSEPSIWQRSALSIDLSAQQRQWSEITTPPFQRRALSVVTVGERIFAVGGIDESGQTSSACDMFDLKSQRWTRCADLPETSELRGFGCAGFVIDNSLIVSLADGSFVKFDEATDSWVQLDQKLDPGRFFHRILPFDGGRAGRCRCQHGRGQVSRCNLHRV